jgi:hypothetical protein
MKMLAFNAYFLKQDYNEGRELTNQPCSVIHIVKQHVSRRLGETLPVILSLKRTTW